MSEEEKTPSEITYDTFAQSDIRTGQITSAERIPKADKLLKLEVDLGELGKRTIAAGLAESYSPEALVGRRCLVVVNLAPRKMKGVESHGMLLAAKRSDGVIELAECLGVASGLRVM